MLSISYFKIMLIVKYSLQTRTSHPAAY